MSGASHPSRGRWLILLNAAESRTRQRFSLAHEFKHVLDDPFIKMLYPPAGGMTTTQRAEQVCNFFAGCLLVPRLWLKRVWAAGVQDIHALARQFEVSVTAMRVRLHQVGLIQPTPRHLAMSIDV
jgi:Zn-dependent peptidase ImmA (M78 family)